MELFLIVLLFMSFQEGPWSSSMQSVSNNRDIYVTMYTARREDCVCHSEPVESLIILMIVKSKSKL